MSVIFHFISEYAYNIEDELYQPKKFKISSYNLLVLIYSCFAISSACTKSTVMSISVAGEI